MQEDTAAVYIYHNAEEEAQCTNDGASPQDEPGGKRTSWTLQRLHTHAFRGSFYLLTSAKYCRLDEKFRESLEFTASSWQ